MNSKLYKVLDKLSDLITGLKSSMNVSDSAQTNKFVTSVSQNNGVISVTRAQPTASDISGLDSAITTKINALDASDSAVTNKFVTAVSETNGIITVTRAQPTMSNISGSANVVYFTDP